MHEAAARAAVYLDPKGKHRLIIRLASAKQRPRRPLDPPGIPDLAFELWDHSRFPPSSDSSFQEFSNPFLQKRIAKLALP
jgi:hypothetical protein